MAMMTVPQRVTVGLWELNDLVLREHSSVLIAGHLYLYLYLYTTHMYTDIHMGMKFQIPST